MVNFEDAGANAAAVLGAPGQFRLAIAADLCMAICDAGLAILLFLIFRTFAPALALSAMVFRLIQTVIIAANLMALQTAWVLLSREMAQPAEQAQSLALLFLELHTHGYDLGSCSLGSIA